MEIYVINNKPTVHMSLDEYKDLLASINKYGAENDELREELHKYKSEHGHYMSKCKKLEEENEVAHKAIKDLIDENFRLRYENDELKEQLKVIEAERMGLLCEKEKLLAEHQRLNEKIEVLEYKYNSLDMSKTIDRLYTEVKRYRATWVAESDVSLRLIKEKQILEDKLAAIEEIIEGES